MTIRVLLAMKNFRLVLLMLTILTGQHALANSLTEEVKHRVQAELNGKCLEMFLFDDKESIFLKSGYQNRTGVFVLGEFNSHQYCARAFKKDWDSWEEAERKAIASCETVRPQGGTPCEVYAHNNGIVYVSIHERLIKARKFLEAGDIPAAESVFNEVKIRNLAKLSPVETGEYEYLFGKVLSNSKTEQARDEAITHFHNSWANHKNVNAAVEEGNLRMMEGGIDKNWQSIRDAYQYFLANASDEQKSLHPEAEKNLNQTDQDYQADLAQKEVVAKEQAILAAVRKKEDEEQARIDVIKAKNYDIKAKREAQKQEKIRQAEMKRQAIEGDGSADDKTCKSYGARPGSDGYISCRIQLGRTKQFLISNERQPTESIAGAAVRSRQQLSKDADASRAGRNAG